MEEIIIKHSRAKIVLAIFGAAGFVILGVLFLIYPEYFTSRICQSLLVIKIAGVLSVLFFGTFFIIVLRAVLIGKSIGLKINKQGIVDHSTFVSVGLILWEDIVEIRRNTGNATKYLLIDVKNSDEYIRRHGKFKSRILKANKSACGTPITLSSHLLSCNFTHLERVLQDAHSAYKSKHQLGAKLSDV